MRRKPSSWAAPALAASLALCACNKKDERRNGEPVVPANASGPNIVLISVDTLRPDHLGCYGYERATSPRIDRLAAEGTLFENAISSTSWTLPAHAALFTGLVDTVHGASDMDRRLDDSRSTLAERFKAAGYVTVGFFSGPALHPVFGVSQGFDEYQDCTSYAELTLKTVMSGESIDGGPVRQAAHADITNPRVYEKVRTWLQRDRQQPFFMFIHMWDVHSDFIPPSPYDGMFDPNYNGTVTGENFLSDRSINPRMPRRDLEHIIALYDGEIAWTDEHVGKILDDLDGLGLRDSTIVMLLGDHGEEFFEHGRKSHRQTLYDEVIRIPLIVRYPGRVPAGRRYREQARMIDVLPTLLELAGLPASDNVMGQSLVPLFSGRRLLHDTLAVSELFSEGRALRSFRRLDLKMIHNTQSNGAHVFNLLADPSEMDPLGSSQSPLAQAIFSDARRASKRLAAFRAAMPAEVSVPTLPDHVRKQLESLGYMRGVESSDEPGQEVP